MIDTRIHVLDERDQAILEERAIAFTKHTTPQQGDFVQFADQVFRVSHVWDDGVQTTGGGSFYLGDGYMSYSGAHCRIVSTNDFVLQAESKLGACWFFHHDRATADNGVYTSIPCRVWKTDLNAPKY